MIKDFIYESIYRDGYFKALLDVKNWFEQHSNSMRYFRMYNAKGLTKILNAMIKDIEQFMEQGEDLEIVIPDK